MSLVSIQIPNLIQGVSQQPAQMRFPSQLEEQTNAYPSVTEGLTKRPPIHHVKKLLTSAPSQFVHFINRDASERYVIVVGASTFKVFTLAGVEKNVYNAMTGTTAFSQPAYLQSPSVLRAMTLADYTFLVNRDTAVAMAGTATSALSENALVTIVQASYASSYTVVLRVSGTNYTYSTETSSNNTATPPIVIASSIAIAADLVTKINAATGTHGIVATQYGSTIYLTKASGTFTVKTQDSSGDSLMTAAKGRVNRISDLPKSGVQGFRIAVGQDQEDPGTGDYYVTFTANDGIGGEGYWTECAAPSTATTLDDTTMPYVLVRRTDGHFACYKPSWTIRAAGDTTTAPNPSFVSRKIKDVFLFRNRLGIVADDKVVMSESGQYFNFFRTTTTQILSSDPIDVSVGHSRIASLQAAVPWDTRLILFSDLTQFSLGASDGAALTPETVEIIQTTEYENTASTCRPVSTGRSILFTQGKGDYAGVREFVRVSIEEDYEGIDITANVASYIEGTARQIAVSTHDSVAFIRTDDGVWCYKWFLSGSEKVQSAWSKFDLGGTVTGMEWFDHELYMVVTRSSNTYLEKMSFSGKDEDDGLTWAVHLDRRITSNGETTGATAGETNFDTGDISYVGLSPVVVVAGVQQPVSSVSSTTIAVKGDFDEEDAIIGVAYDMAWKFSRQFPRKQDQVLLNGRFQLTYGRLSFSDTGHFIVTVTPAYRDPFSYPYNGGRLGGSIVVGEPFLDTDSFRFPIHCRAEDATIEVTSDSYLPCRIQAAEFEGRFAARSRSA